MECCGALELQSDVERSSCGVLSFAMLELWSLRARFRDKKNTRVLFFHGFHGFFKYEFAKAPTCGSLVLFHVLFFLLVVVPLKTITCQQSQRLSSSLPLVLAPLRHKDDSAQLSFSCLFFISLVIREK